MRELLHNLNLNYAQQLLDNGGRWWHVITLAADGYIEESELSAVAGSSLKYLKPYLLLRVILTSLPQHDRQTLLNKLSPSIASALDRCVPFEGPPSTVPDDIPNGWPVIIEGICTYADQKAYLASLVPEYFISTGRNTSVTCQHYPATKSHRVFELKNASDGNKRKVPMIIPSDKSLPTNCILRAAGVIRHFIQPEDDYTVPEFYVRPLFFSHNRVRKVCPACAYDLRGNPEGKTCPECGAGMLSP